MVNKEVSNAGVETKFYETEGDQDRVVHSLHDVVFPVKGWPNVSDKKQCSAAPQPKIFG